MIRVERTQAFVLHSRSYRETSLLLDVFSLEHGRVHLIAKGAKKTHKQGLLQPFVLLEMAFQGRTELLTLTRVESLEPPCFFRGDVLLCALYLNELLVRLLAAHDVHADLFATYRHTLQEIRQAKSAESALRYFEKNLLNDLGYGLDFSAIKPEEYYHFSTEYGFTVSQHPEIAFKGAHLLEFSHHHFTTTESLACAKRLMRSIFSELLGSKTLHTRELFV